MTNQNKNIESIDLRNNEQVFQSSKAINMDGKLLYSKRIDGKGSSQVTLSTQLQKPNASNKGKIQKKMYRKNTQSKQVDGLFKPEKF